VYGKVVLVQMLLVQIYLIQLLVMMDVLNILKHVHLQVLVVLLKEHVQHIIHKLFVLMLNQLILLVHVHGIVQLHQEKLLLVVELRIVQMQLQLL
jgi:hypothetical protein